jgi:hypothetical protein
MSHRRAKKIRKMLCEAGRSVDAKPYRIMGSTIIASPERRGYQKLKKLKETS